MKEQIKKFIESLEKEKGVDANKIQKNGLPDSKTLFERLDFMNKFDAANKTSTLGICNSLVEVKKTKAGGEVTIGVPESVAMNLILNQENYIALLIVVDLKAYEGTE